MYGLDAITAHNGWAIALVGVAIVFSGLVSLSISISLLHKVLYLYENPKLFLQWIPEKIQRKSFPPITSDQRVAIKQFSLLLNKMPSHFSLPRLLHLAQLRGIKDPHSHLSLLISLGAVFPDHDGFFCWDSETVEQVLQGRNAGKKEKVQ